MSLHLAHILRMLQVQLVNLENEASHERKYELQVGHLKRCLQRHQVRAQKYGENQIIKTNSDYCQSSLYSPLLLLGQFRQSVLYFENSAF